MFLKRNVSKVRGKEYVNYVLVESVLTEKGPRHKVVCSLGRLDPGPRDQWLALAHKLESALAGQPGLFEDPALEKTVERARKRQAKRAAKAQAQEPQGEVLPVCVDQVTTEMERPAGAVHVGHQMWQKLEMDDALEKAGLSDQARQLTEVMVLNRLIAPSSEHAMPAWVDRTAVSDVVGIEKKRVTDTALYRNMDRLHEAREQIETDLSAREKDLFDIDDTVWLYDLTSTYFEGGCERNSQAKRGYSRDSRSDCKQVVIGLVVNRDGFPLAHEVFDGNRTDKTTVEEMLQILKRRRPHQTGATVVVDRGMAFDENLAQIKKQNCHYIVASRQGERLEFAEDFEDESGWEEVTRQLSETNAWQNKSPVFVKRRTEGDTVVILCHSERREEKDRAIREKHDSRLRKNLTRLKDRVAKGRLKDEKKIHEAIGRLKERHPRVARYYEIAYDKNQESLTFSENQAKKQKARKLDGAYVLKTDRQDLTAEEIWRTYTLLTRVENAFRNLKSPLMERPIFHQTGPRVRTHIFICLLAYHLLAAIEHTLQNKGIHSSWATLRDALETHIISTVVLPLADGRVLRIRRSSTPEKVHREIYQALSIPAKIMTPVKTWSQAE